MNNFTDDDVKKAALALLNRDLREAGKVGVRSTRAAEKKHDMARYMETADIVLRATDLSVHRRADAAWQALEKEKAHVAALESLAHAILNTLRVNHAGLHRSELAALVARSLVEAMHTPPTSPAPKPAT